MATNDSWLAQVQEETIDPALPICDPHHHLWDHRDGRVERRYLLDEILRRPAHSGHNVVSTVFIEHLAMYRAEGPDEMKYVGEVEFANGIAAMAASGLYGKTKVAAGIVGYADLADGIARAGGAGGGDGRRARSLSRHPLHRRLGPGPAHRACAKAGHCIWMARFREGLAELDALGLVFDVTSRYHQLSECADLAKAFPRTTMVLNHLGGITGIGAYAGRREEIFAAWRKGMADLAKCPNVVVKLGGLAMEYCGFGWHEQVKPPTSRQLADATRPYYEAAIELFGPDRCMFESNFPVDKVSCSYNVLWNSFKRVTATYSASEKAKLHHDTAVRVYKLT